MTSLLTEAQAIERLGADAATFQELRRAGWIRPRAEGLTRFWPEEIVLAAARRHAGGNSLAGHRAILTVGRIVASITDPDMIESSAIRFATVLTGASDVALYRLSPLTGRLTDVSSYSLSSQDRRRPSLLPESLPEPFGNRPALIQLSSPPDGDASPGSSLGVMVPLRAANRVLGALLIAGWPGDERPSAESLDELEALAMVTAGALASTSATEPSGPDGHSKPRMPALNMIVETSRAVALQGNLESTLRTLVDGMGRSVPHTMVTFYRADNSAHSLQPIFHASSNEFSVADRDLAYGAGIAGRVALSGKPVLVNHAERDHRAAMDLLQPSHLVDAIEQLHLAAIPLQVEGGLVGVAGVVRVDGPPFNDDEFALAQIFMSQAAAAMRNAELTLMQKERYLGGIRALVSAVDAKDVYARGHSEQVSRLARALAEALALPLAVVDQVELAALLHDIGKIGIPDVIVQKLGALDDAERAVMMGHTMLGAAILADSRSEALQELIPLVRHHHEWHNGRGYPDGLAGDDIPFGAAIIAVADAFVAMTTERPYRVGRSPEGALDELRQGVGTQFHPSIVLAAQQLAADGRLAGHALLPASRHSAALAPKLGFGLPTLAASPSSDNGEDDAHDHFGDLRALGLMIELAGITSLIPELSEFLQRVATLLRRRLGYEDVMVLLWDSESSALMVASQSGSLRLAALGERLPLADNACSEVFRTAKLRLLANLSTTGTDFGRDAGSALIVPLVVEGETIGVLHVAAKRSDAFTSGDTAVLLAIAGQIASSIHVAQVHDATKAAALTDGLTGLANHRAFYQALESASRRRQPIGVLLFDVIGLKRVNDGAGHLAGDLLLQTVAKTIRTVVRPSDVVARYGGDEFAVIVGGSLTAAEAIAVGDRIKQALHEAVSALDLPQSTLRFGVAVLPDDGISPHELVLAADRRMYQAQSTWPPREGTLPGPVAETSRSDWSESVLNGTSPEADELAEPVAFGPKLILPEPELGR